ncbi:MAG: DNA polymerase III subunit gamma/tau, partial [Terriglobia bacterium]
EAFNALLKTIEEPPEWAVFILCTTETHKIPATIASRCQHFSFRSVDFNDLIGRMREICIAEGIETDDEALSVIAQSGEGSVRDSLSALDQAIACCGKTLNADAIRTLLGAFGIDAMSQVSAALSNQDGAAMLGLVDELERNGGSPQHFARELCRYIRNLLVTRIAGGNSSLIVASPSERAEMTRIAAGFSEEDLTRYTQLALDLFRDLQYSLQPRFHLEIGLLKMVQAGKLIALEDALAGLGTQQPPSRPAPVAAAPAARPSAHPPVQAAPPPPSPISADDDWRAKLQTAMAESGLQFSADAMAQSEVSLVNNELIVTTAKSFQLDLGREEILTALKRLGHPTLRFKVVFGDVKASSAPAPKPAPREDEVTGRALAHPEIQRFREVFGGEVRAVRNLKES